MPLTQDRDTPERAGDLYEYPVAATALIYAGAIVVLDAAGNAEPGATALNKTAVGRAEERADNAVGAAADINVKVKPGVFKFKNDVTHTIDKTHVGGTAYIVDDETVASTDGTGTRSAAGVIKQVETDGVWVKLG